MVVHSAMNDEVHAIILKQMDYREKDILVTAFTEEYGKLSFVAGGARKLTSKNAGGITPYVQAALMFDYKPHMSMFRLKTASMVKAYPKIHTELIYSAASAVVCSVMDFMALPHNEDGLCQKQFSLLSMALELLENHEDPHTVLSLYIADVLNMFGSSPYVDGCAVCHQTSVSSISVKDGGFVCKNHAALEDLAVLLSQDLKRFRLLTKATLERYPLIHEAAHATLQDVEYFMMFAHTYTGVSLDAFIFYKQVCSLNMIV